ncbi:uncharacterized protein EI90DRAFT_3122952 [Cantharellus anzutake]|uniref:uncharacterized protein n=1 Tax=Cantharellus anzutake TaxID=1750568 RepID=UPI0019085F80|nr:uncharacterized protein EI90DRAFT_3122952 [Cantharellus anzutake]KAF8331859.1 hypothetical protein EI90DRAFT_3122952 [Cantharellus anzutake]
MRIRGTREGAGDWRWRWTGGIPEDMVEDYLLLRLSPTLPPIYVHITSGTPTLFWTYLNSHSYLQTSPTTPPPPWTSCSKDMDLLVVGNPQLAYPPSFLLLVSAAPAPPVMYLQYLPTPTLPLVMLFFIVLSFDIFYNPNLQDYNFQAPDLSRHLPL